jgi:hypothetical protein
LLFYAARLRRERRGAQAIPAVAGEVWKIASRFRDFQCCAANSILKLRVIRIPFPGRAPDNSVMPGLVPGIHAFAAVKEDVDGRDKPGHDKDVTSCPTTACLPSAPPAR